MSKKGCKVISLALQGGGSHGAVTWGALDKILSDNRLSIEAISGTSAGAMNAVVLADGLQRGGNEGAREALSDFWKAVSDAGRYSPIQRSWWDRLIGSNSLDTSPAYLFFESLTHLLSPQQINPFNINPVRSLLAERVDFERVNDAENLRVYVTATSVRTGHAKVFRQPNLSADTTMASACLPQMFSAVKIDGEAYWDGGYSGNPALYPLVDDQQCSDLVVVQINPVVREDLPTSARDIMNRINEITFNSSLIKDLRSIHLLHEVISTGDIEAESYRAKRLHHIHAEKEVQEWSASSKYNTEWDYLKCLHDRGWHWAERWLDQHFDDIGERSSFNLNELFEGSFRPVIK